MFSASHRLHSDPCRMRKMPLPMANATILTDTVITTRLRSWLAVQSMRALAWFAIWWIWIVLHREILERLDHQNLNTLVEFAGTIPTTENLCVAVYDILQRGFRIAHLEKVRFEETMMNSFEYAGRTLEVIGFH